LKTTSILIAEDESIIVLDLKSLLKKSGYTNVSVVSDGEDLVKRAMIESPSLIISDVFLKGKLNGLKAADKIWEKNSVPFIFISGMEIDKNNINLSNCEIVKKPFKGDEILKAVQRFLK
jgi:two-component system, response regulator PdtaR